MAVLGGDGVASNGDGNSAGSGISISSGGGGGGGGGFRAVGGTGRTCLRDNWHS